MHEQLTPRQIVAELDKYIVGQTEAKKSVAIALRNRWRRMNVPEAMREEIMPNNIIMIGPTGVGKTEIARRLARLAGAPFVKVEATKFTEVGYVGRDVDSMIRDLADVAVGMVKAEQTERVQGEARRHAEERVLDALIPPTSARRTPERTAGGPATSGPINGPGFVIQPPAEAAEEADLRERTRERFRAMLQRGELDTREIEVDVVSEATNPMLQMFGPMGMEEMGINMQEMFGHLGGKKRKRRRMPVAEALEVLTQEEAQKLIDIDAVQKEALERVQQAGIVFIDEIDKVAGGSTGPQGGPNVSREGVQRDLLPIVEGSSVTTKYGMVKTDHILFVASGAFHVAKPSDLIPELQGRFPIRVELSSLTEDDFYQILTVPKNALLKQYEALLATEGVEIAFTDQAVRAIARIAARVNDEVENIGARRLHTILTTLLEEVLYEVPEGHPEGRLEITEAFVNERLEHVVQNRDLSQYIL